MDKTTGENILDPTEGLQPATTSASPQITRSKVENVLLSQNRDTDDGMIVDIARIVYKKISESPVLGLKEWENISRLMEILIQEIEKKIRSHPKNSFLHGILHELKNNNIQSLLSKIGLGIFTGEKVLNMLNNQIRPRLEILTLYLNDADIMTSKLSQVFEKLSGIQDEITVDIENEWLPAKEVTGANLFMIDMIVQEILTNYRKYGVNGSIKVQVQHKNDGNVLIMEQSNAKKTNIDAHSTHQGVSLMREYIGYLRGQLDIKQDDSTYTLKIAIPLSRLV